MHKPRKKTSQNEKLLEKIRLQLNLSVENEHKMLREQVIPSHAALMLYLRSLSHIFLLLHLHDGTLKPISAISD